MGKVKSDTVADPLATAVTGRRILPVSTGLSAKAESVQQSMPSRAADRTDQTRQTDWRERCSNAALAQDQRFCSFWSCTDQP